MEPFPQYAFNVALLSIFGKEDRFDREEVKRLYYVLEKGYNSMPINLPGTLFHKAMKARKELSAIVAAILHKRRDKAERHNDLLSSFMSEKAALTDAQISDNVIGMIFAARDTTASVLTWILKYLAENPSVLKAVTVSFNSQCLAMRFSFPCLYLLPLLLCPSQGIHFSLQK